MTRSGRRLGGGGVLLACLLLGCGSGADSTDASEPAPTTSSPARVVREVEEAPTATTVVPTTTTTTTTTLAPPIPETPVGALVTETGVVLPIRRGGDRPLVVTPCQNERVVTNPAQAVRSLAGVHVVLDPGHGGLEPGAVTADGLSEAELNYSVAQIAQRQLEGLGFVAVLTRYGDHRVPLATRVEVAEALDAPLLVSIHHQGTETNIPVQDEPGTEIYHQIDAPESKRFAGLLHEEAIEHLGAFEVEEWFAGVDAGATRRPNAATGEDFYGMVRLPSMPAVLAEMAFMGNPAEIELLATRRFRVAEAQAITDAVVRWYTTDDPGSGFVEPSFGLRSSGGGGGLAGCADPDLGLDTADPPNVTLGVGE